MQLYTYPPAPNPARVGFYLNEKGLEIERVMVDFRSAASAEGTWFREAFPDLSRDNPVAYFCAEFGLHNSIPIYSGGLGVLAGDHCKSASDLGLPFVGVGLLYRRGYFRQAVDADGRQQHHQRQ